MLMQLINPRRRIVHPAPQGELTELILHRAGRARYTATDDTLRSAGLHLAIPNPFLSFVQLITHPDYSLR